MVCCEEVEKEVHLRLHAHRKNPDREFFLISADEAVKVVREIATKYRHPAGKAREFKAVPSELDLLCPTCWTRYSKIALDGGAKCPKCGDTVSAVNSHGRL